MEIVFSLKKVNLTRMKINKFCTYKIDAILRNNSENIISLNIFVLFYFIIFKYYTESHVSNVK